MAHGPGREDIIFRDLGRGIYKRLLLDGDRPVGTVIYDDTADSSWFFGLIKDQTGINQHPARGTDLRPGLSGRGAVDPLWLPLQHCRLTRRNLRLQRRLEGQDRERGAGRRRHTGSAARQHQRCREVQRPHRRVAHRPAGRPTRKTGPAGPVWPPPAWSLAMPIQGVAHCESLRRQGVFAASARRARPAWGSG